MRWSTRNHARPHRHVAVGVAATAALTLSACGGSPEAASGEPPEPAGSIDELVSLAQDEGELTLYGSPSQLSLEAAADAFSEEYGITVSTVRLVGNELAARFAAEVEAGAPTADVFLMNMSTFYAQAIDSGIITPLEDLEMPGFPWELPTEYLRPDSGTAVVGLQVRGITYNTDLVSESEAPTSWADVTDPQWAGQIGIADPGSAPVYIGHWQTISEHEGGEEFLQAINELDPEIYASGAPATAAVGAGEIAIFPVNIGSLTTEAQEQGAPLEFVIPEGTTADEQALGVNATAEHPYAAQLFAQYMMSEEGSMVLAEAGNEFSPFDEERLPELWPWDVTLADEQHDAVIEALTG